MLIDFLSTVLMSNIHVVFGYSLCLLSYARSFPSKPFLINFSMIKESFSILLSVFAVFSQGISCVTTGIYRCLGSNFWCSSY